jgi:uncharacterized protein YbbC (DUF1343 family)
MKSPVCFRLRLSARLAAVLAGVAAMLGGGCASRVTPPVGYVPSPPFYNVAPPSSPRPAPPVHQPPPVATPAPARNERVLLGIDVLAAEHFSILQGKRVGLLTHPPGVNSAGVSTIDVLRAAPGVRLVELYAPEHGLYGDVKAGDEMPKLQVDKRTGLPVYNLYQTPDGDYRKPSPDMLRDIDVMVVDMQDLGTRSYTFISCLLCTMEACFEQNKTVVVLDRPNPLGGLKVGGPIIEDKWMSYVGAYRVPYVFGLTIGELARIAKDNPNLLPIVLPKLFKVSADVWARGRLVIVPMRGWRRSMLWPQTGLKWIPTSPNIPTPAAAFGYSLTGLASAAGIGNFGLGVGTPYPFRLLNYPDRPPVELAAALNALKLPGLSFTPLVYGDRKDKSGVYVNILDWNAVDPTRLAFELMRLDAGWTQGGNPYARADDGKARTFNIYAGSTAWWGEISTKGRRADVAGLFKTWDAQDATFQQWTRQWWFYPE